MNMSDALIILILWFGFDYNHDTSHLSINIANNLTVSDKKRNKTASVLIDKNVIFNINQHWLLI